MKIAICTPCHGSPRLAYTVSLARLLIRSANAGIDLRYLTVSLAVLPLARENLVKAARMEKADAILWIDADHTFPDDALERLIAADKPVIGCNYPTRGAPHGPTAARAPPGGKLEMVTTTKDLAERGEIERVDAMGLGFCLMRVDVLEGIEGPLFRFTYGHDGKPIGEDAWLFYQLRDRGIEVYVDHGLSWQIGHIREQALTNAMVQGVVQ